MPAEGPIVHVVDDDDALRDAMGSLLRVAGFNVRLFADANALLGAVNALTEGCLVLDVRMPGMNGLELQHALKGRGIHMPVIILTGHGDVPMAVAALKAGALDFMEKPFDHLVLIGRVGDALAQDAAQRSSRDAAAAAGARVGLLSPREREVMEFVAAGLSNKAIANRLGISSRTVETHRARVMEKTGATSVSELTRLALELRDQGP